MNRHEFADTNQFNSSERSAMSRLYSSSVVHDFARYGQSHLWTRLLKEVPALYNLVPSTQVRTVYDKVHKILMKPNYRQEYVYKSAIVNKVLLGKYSLNTATLLSEFRVNDRKADVVILNGKSIAYEIKSEHDRLDRLIDQLEAYTRMFAESYVVTGENHIKIITSTVPQEVGILTFNNRHGFATLREPVDLRDRINVETVFDSLRTTEIRDVLRLLQIELPQIPNTLARSELRKPFIMCDPHEIHDAMVSTLCRTRSKYRMREFIRKLPESLRAAVISSNIRPSSYELFLSAMHTSLKEARKWK